LAYAFYSVFIPSVYIPSLATSSQISLLQVSILPKHHFFCCFTSPDPGFLTLRPPSSQHILVRLDVSKSLLTHLQPPNMCYQVVERYSVCRCLYYKHAIDPCASHGQRGHLIQEKTVLVGYACSTHSSSRPEIAHYTGTLPDSGYGSGTYPPSYLD